MTNAPRIRQVIGSILFAALVLGGLASFASITLTLGRAVAAAYSLAPVGNEEGVSDGAPSLPGNPS